MTAPNTVFLFPGQGAQYPGIGKDLFDEYRIVRDTYSEASDALGYDVGKLSFDDPGNQIHLTRYTQPVLLTHSTACHRVFRELTGNRVTPDIAAGHSLGEYSALVCAGSIGFEPALRLVQTRGELMGEWGEGEMQALMVDLDTARTLAEQHYCGMAACNLPEQNVVGGRPEDLDLLVSALSETSPRARSARLKTEGAFHTYYMVEAARRFRKVLEGADFEIPEIRVLSNFTGACHDGDTDSIRSRLFLQLFNPVLWYRNLLAAAGTGDSLMIEFGGGLGGGQTAAEKRPNLESIVKRAFRTNGSPPRYLSVINLPTLENAVKYFQD